MRTHSARQRAGLAARLLVPTLTVACIALAVVCSILDRQSQSVTLNTPTAPLRVELADSPAARAAGLSNRDAVTGDGLLLQWDAPGRRPIWMADMRFALDLVWLDKTGNVLALLDSVPPCSQQPCPLYEPPDTAAAIAVLELPAGDAKRGGIAVGAVLRRADESRP